MVAPAVYAVIVVGGRLLQVGYRAYQAHRRAGRIQRVVSINQRAQRARSGAQAARTTGGRCTGNCARGAGSTRSLRRQYMGRTPGKRSRTGREVQERMRREGLLRGSGRRTEFRASDGRWYNIRHADMSHRTDAVRWWNSTGRRYGARSPEVRRWMLDSRNYRLDHSSINRSAGARLTDRYLPPLR